MLPQASERTRRELSLQVAFAPVVIATRGYAAPEVETIYLRARELCQQLQESSQVVFPVLWGLAFFYVIQGRYRKGYELGTQLLSLDQKERDPALLLEAYQALGITLFWEGELTSARSQLGQGIALYVPEQHHSLAFSYGGHDPGVACLNDDALALWLLGYPAQALERSQEWLALAHKLSHSYTLSQTFDWAAIFYQFCQQARVVREQAEACLALSAEHGFAYYRAVGMILRGWALAEEQEGEEGIILLRQ